MDRWMKHGWMNLFMDAWTDGCNSTLANCIISLSNEETPRKLLEFIELVFDAVGCSLMNELLMDGRLDGRVDGGGGGGGRDRCHTNMWLSLKQ